MTKRRNRTPKFGQAMPEETWGDKMLRAYRLFRAEHGLVYEDVADRLNEVGIATSQPVVADLSDFDEVPARPNTRLLAYWVICAYGRNPAEWGLDDTTVNLAAFDVAGMVDQLNPNTWGPDARIRRRERLAERKAARAR